MNKVGADPFRHGCALRWNFYCSGHRIEIVLSTKKQNGEWACVSCGPYLLRQVQSRWLGTVGADEGRREQEVGPRCRFASSVAYHPFWRGNANSCCGTPQAPRAASQHNQLAHKKSPSSASHLFMRMINPDPKFALRILNQTKTVREMKNINRH